MPVKVRTDLSNRSTLTATEFSEPGRTKTDAAASLGFGPNWNFVRQAAVSRLTVQVSLPSSVYLTCAQVTDVPFRELPKGLSEAALEYLAKIDPSTASKFDLQLIDAALTGFPEPKGKTGSQRTQV